MRAPQVLLIIRSGKLDATKAANLADDGNYRRIALRARVQQYRFDFEEQRCKATREVKAKKLKGAAELKKLVELIAQHLEGAEREMNKSVDDFRKKGTAADRTWFDAEIKSSIATIRQEAQTLILSISRRTTYNPLTLEERRSIIKAFGFTHIGHFYRCPNGHSFVIGEVSSPPCVVVERLANASSTLPVRRSDANLRVPRMPGADRRCWSRSQQQQHCGR